MKNLNLSESDAAKIVQVARDQLVSQIANLSPEDVVRLLGRTAPAPAESEVLPVRRKRGKPAKISAMWKDETKVCPACGKKKKIDPDFGVVIARGLQKPQSWCRQCRASTNYYNQPRKYVKHEP